jgi:hypothetical protein
LLWGRRGGGGREGATHVEPPFKFATIVFVHVCVKEKVRKRDEDIR